MSNVVVVVVDFAEKMFPNVMTVATCPGLISFFHHLLVIHRAIIVVVIPLTVRWLELVVKHLWLLQLVAEHGLVSDAKWIVTLVTKVVSPLVSEHLLALLLELVTWLVPPLISKPVVGLIVILWSLFVVCY